MTRTEMINVETLSADAEAALELDRERGVPLPKDELVDSIYKVGFMAGAQWALRKLQKD